jgi:hypothetical protein
VLLNIVKKNQDADFWPRITKEKVKNQFIVIDWAKWIDEDDEGEPEKPMGQDWN